MKVLLIDTSDGDGVLKDAIALCSDLLNDENIETEIKYAGNVHPCTSCGKCLKRRRCLFEGVANEINDEADSFDALIVGSEVIYGEITRNAKNFLDCLFRSSNERYAHKIASCILYERKGNSRDAYNKMISYFSYSCMPFVTGRYLNTVCGMDEKDRKEIQILVKNMSWLLKHEGRNDEVPDKLVDFMRGR